MFAPYLSILVISEGNWGPVSIETFVLLSTPFPLTKKLTCGGLVIHDEESKFSFCTTISLIFSSRGRVLSIKMSVNNISYPAFASIEVTRRSNFS
uniref:Uncharacterized protein n=1 Tax=Arundo donax TaxID=35708 RepID=A0A0A8ZCS8_ARUDO